MNTTKPILFLLAVLLATPVWAEDHARGFGPYGNGGFGGGYGGNGFGGNGFGGNGFGGNGFGGNGFGGNGFGGNGFGGGGFGGGGGGGFGGGGGGGGMGGGGNGRAMANELKESGPKVVEGISKNGQEIVKAMSESSDKALEKQTELIKSGTDESQTKETVTKIGELTPKIGKTDYSNPSVAAFEKELQSGAEAIAKAEKDAVQANQARQSPAPAPDTSTAMAANIPRMNRNPMSLVQNNNTSSTDIPRLSGGSGSSVATPEVSTPEPSHSSRGFMKAYNTQGLKVR
jgi:hypothetical protein